MSFFDSLARNRKLRLPPFGAYLALVACWFFSFGLQTTLFPGVITFTLGESPERLGIAQAALTAPMMLLLPLAGVLAERRDRRGIMFYFYIFAGLSALALAALLFTDRLSYWVMVSFALMIGVAGAFVMPARDSAINPVVRIAALTRHGGVDLQRAVVMTSTVQFAAQLAGMGVGYFAAWTGPAALFALQGVGLIIGGGAAAFIPRLGSNRGRSTAHPLADLVDGWRAVVHSPVLMPMTAIMVAIGFLVVGGGFLVLIPLLIRETYGGGFQEIASLMVCFWLGALAANLVLVRFRQIERPGRAVILAQCVTVLALGAFALPMPLWALYVLVFFWGLGAGVAISLSRSVVQEQAPPAKLARVMSVYQLGLFGGMPAGAVIMGFVIGATGPHTAALIPMGGLAAVLVLICLTTPILSVRRGHPAAHIIASEEPDHAQADR